MSPSSASPQPAPATRPVSQGRYNATIVRVTAELVTISTDNGQFSWHVGSPAVYAALSANVGKPVQLFWRTNRADGEINVVGVDGADAAHDIIPADAV